MTNERLLFATLDLEQIDLKTGCLCDAVPWYKCMHYKVCFGHWGAIVW